MKSVPCPADLNIYDWNTTNDANIIKLGVVHEHSSWQPCPTECGYYFIVFEKCSHSHSEMSIIIAVFNVCKTFHTNFTAFWKPYCSYHVSALSGQFCMVYPKSKYTVESLMTCMNFHPGTWSLPPSTLLLWSPTTTDELPFPKSSPTMKLHCHLQWCICSSYGSPPLFRIIQSWFHESVFHCNVKCDHHHTNNSCICVVIF